jgi:hypothetical protein
MDPRPGGIEHPIKFRVLPTPLEKANGRALAPYWKFFNNNFEDSTNYIQGMRLRTDTRRGRLSAVTEDDMWLLAWINLDDGEVRLNQDSLDHFGWTATMVTTGIKEIA